MSEQKKSLADAIKVFDRKEMPVEAAGAPAAPAQDEARLARRRDLAVLAACEIEALIGLLGEEVEAIHSLKFDMLPVFAERKEAIVIGIEELAETWNAERMAEDEPHLFDDELSRRLREAADANLEALGRLHEVAERVAALHIKAVEEMNNEGLYGATGRSLRAAELSPAGIALDL
jgi:1,6-anhydro-N-acetylmuramate kinase